MLGLTCGGENLIPADVIRLLVLRKRLIDRSNYFFYHKFEMIQQIATEELLLYCLQIWTHTSGHGVLSRGSP